jgi:hypothetical protein
MSRTTNGSKLAATSAGNSKQAIKVDVLRRTRFNILIIPNV